MSLDTVLFFFSGLHKMPILGFDPIPTLEFDSTYTYAKSSVCLNKLILPTQYNEYRKCKEMMDVSVTMHGGFGQY